MGHKKAQKGSDSIVHEGNEEVQHCIDLESRSRIWSRWLKKTLVWLTCKASATSLLVQLVAKLIWYGINETVGKVVWLAGVLNSSRNGKVPSSTIASPRTFSYYFNQHISEETFSLSRQENMGLSSLEKNMNLKQLLLLWNDFVTREIFFEVWTEFLNLDKHF